jgi:AraC-like DNA-binding protein
VSHASRAVLIAKDEGTGSGIVTLIDPGLRSRLALALDTAVPPYHARSVGEALAVVRERPVQAVLLGQSSLSPESLPAVGKLAGACAGLLILVMAGSVAQPSDTLLTLGRYGVRDVVDVSTREGLVRLRSLVGQPEWELARRIISAFRAPLDAATNEMREYLTKLIQWAPTMPASRRIAAAMGVRDSSFNSRFFRAGLPSPKQYLATIRLLFAAGVLENRSLSIADTANRLNYSSPQSFIRHLRTMLGMHGKEFREKCPFDALSAHARFRLLETHAHTLKWFRPL